MTFFGFKIVRLEKLEILTTCVDAMIEHVESKGGFINENGDFTSDGNNKQIASHWSMFRILEKNYWNHKKELV